MESSIIFSSFFLITHYCICDIVKTVFYSARIYANNITDVSETLKNLDDP